MADENETVDWGLAEDGQRESLRRTVVGQNADDCDDVDDIEDTVSLGDEDEDQGFYSYQPQDAPGYAHTSEARKDTSSKPPSSQRPIDKTGANDNRRAQHEGERDGQHHDTIPNSPPRPRNSSGSQSSPQRSQPNGNRMTHALPPKPVTAKVPYLPPSHPSIVEATSMISISPRAPSRDAKKPSGPSVADLPQEWEIRHSRNGDPYYYNCKTNETTTIAIAPEVETAAPAAPALARHQIIDIHLPRLTLTLIARRPLLVMITTQVTWNLKGMCILASELIPMSFQNPGMTDLPPDDALVLPRRLLIFVAEGTQEAMNIIPSMGNTPVRDIDMLPPDSDRRWISSHVAPTDHRSHSDRSERERGSRRPSHRQDDEVDATMHVDNRSISRPIQRRHDGNRGLVDRRDRDMREPPNNNQGYLSSSRPNRSPPPTQNRGRERDRDRDQRYADPPSARDSRDSYRSYHEEPPHSAPASSTWNSSRKDGSRPPRFDHSFDANGGQASGLQEAHYGRPSPGFDSRQSPPPHIASQPQAPRRRGGERERERDRERDHDHDRPRHERDRDRQPPMEEEQEYRRRPDSGNYITMHPAPESRPLAMERRRYPPAEDMHRPQVEDQSPRYKRTPLPPQQTSFMTSTPPSYGPSHLPPIGPLYMRDPPPHAASMPPHHAHPPVHPPPPPVIRQPGWANYDSSLPRHPRYTQNVSKPRPDDVDSETLAKGQSRGKDEHPSMQQHLPKQDLRMEMDARSDRMGTDPVDLPPKSSGSARYESSPVLSRSQNQRGGGYQPRNAEDRVDVLPSGPKAERQRAYGVDRAPSVSQGPMGGLVRDKERGRDRQSDGMESMSSPLSRGPDSARFEQTPGEGYIPPSHARDERGRNRGRPDDRPEHGVQSTDDAPRRDFKPRDDEAGRAPAPAPLSLSGTNNVPIGVRRQPPLVQPTAPLVPPPVPPPQVHVPPVPPVHISHAIPIPLNGIPPPFPPQMFNPAARPPASTLINPAKARDLPPGKEVYERPPHMPPLEPSQRFSQPNEVSSQSSPPLSEKSQAPPPMPNAETGRRRESRFSPPVERKSRFNPPIPIETRPRGDGRVDEQNHPNERKAAPPPISRDPSLVSSIDRGSARHASDDTQSVESRDGRYDRPSKSDATLPPGNPPSQPPFKQNEIQPLSGSHQERPPPSGERFGQRNTRWGPGDGSSAQSPEQAFPPPPANVSLSPALSRRLSASTDRPPRHRKYFDAPDARPPVGVSPEFSSNSYGRETEDSHRASNARDKPPNKRGQSLLDRLSFADDDPLAPPEVPTQSLRDRLVPSKRDRDDMLNDNGDFRDASYDGDEGIESKRARRRSGKPRRGSHGAGGGGRRFGS
ncbi:unnamed protein product [Cyclocybe aegerita]|uniref:WW domain-containing protein n=1 Tax=Cyclocybe aegerita TaxID=1973307 RepID=A0A8S0VUH9_CYCAE|nr:unnamed protein product [Cyclocybe aegerita]